MLAAVVEGAHRLVVRDVPMPELGPHDALVKIEAGGLCNSTDVKILARMFVSGIPVPLVLGHEWVGKVVVVGTKVTCYQVGQRVLRAGAFSIRQAGLASGLGRVGRVRPGNGSHRVSHGSPGRPAQRPVGQQQVVPGDLHAAEATALITLKETLFAVRAAGVDHTTWTAIVGSGPVGRSLFLGPLARRAVPGGIWSARTLVPRFLDLGANYYLAGDRPCAGDDTKCGGPARL